MTAVKAAFERLDEKFGGVSNAAIARMLGVDNERVGRWRKGEADADMKTLTAFATLFEEAGMPLAPFQDARMAILEIFGPWMAKVEADLEELKAQRVQVIVSETDKIKAGTPRELQKAVGAAARSGLKKATEKQVETKGRTAKKKAG